MTFEDLIAPMSAAEFTRDYWGKKPVLIPADAGCRRPRIGWDHLNALFQIRPHWTEANIKLILNGQPVNPDFYMGGEGLRLANIKQVENFTAMGASLVVDAVQQISPEIRELTNMLATRFGALTGANFYASFKGVQAFASHFDTHEVLALHCEGQKRWRIYQNRAENPVEILSGEDAQRIIDAAKGPVVMDVVLNPGDLLYIPRGYFHDAIAIDTASLHLTLGFAPVNGTLLPRLIEALAVEDPAFRAYLPLAEEDGGAGLAERLGELADRLGAIVRSPRFRDLIETEQRRFVQPSCHIGLPHRPSLHFYARTQTPIELVFPADGAVLRVAGREIGVGVLSDVASFIIERPAFSVEELQAKAPHHAPHKIDALVAELQRLGAIVPYQPPIG